MSEITIETLFEQIKCLNDKIERLEGLNDKIEQTENTIKIMIDGIGLKLDGLSLNGPPTIKRQAINKKPKMVGINVPETVPANTMIWWKKMYADKNDIIKVYYNDDDIKKAEIGYLGIKSKAKANATGYEKQLAIGRIIYSTFDPKKKKILKGIYETWKKEQEQNKTVSIDRESNTDDEKCEKKEDSTIPTKKQKQTPQKKKVVNKTKEKPEDDETTE